MRILGIRHPLGQPEATPQIEQVHNRLRGEDQVEQHQRIEDRGTAEDQALGPRLHRPLHLRQREPVEQPGHEEGPGESRDQAPQDYPSGLQ
jgi:hypothetical protein